MEIYKEIKNYENYEISNLGKIRNKKTGKFIKQSVVGGYMHVLLNKNGEQKNFYVHRLIAEYFIENKNGLTIVDHRDTNKLNNSISNLRFCTASENCKNKKTQKNNKLKIKNIQRRKNGKFYVRIASNGAMTYSKLFDNLNDAIIARNQNLLILHKEFANYN